MTATACTKERKGLTLTDKAADMAVVENTLNWAFVHGDRYHISFRGGVIGLRLTRPAKGGGTVHYLQHLESGALCLFDKVDEELVETDHVFSSAKDAGDWLAKFLK